MKMAKTQMASTIQEWMLTEMAPMLLCKAGLAGASANIGLSKIINVLFVALK